MARKLDALFLDAAVVPLNRAGRLLEARHVDAALADLSRESLVGAMREGVETVAKLAGYAAFLLFQRLSMEEIEALAADLDESHRQALAAWQAFGGRSELDAGEPGELDEQGAAPDPSQRLQDLAAQVQTDRALATALGELSESVTRWQQTVKRCHTIVAGAKDLSRSYRKRRWIRIGIMVAVIIAIVSTSAWWLRRQLSRSRVDGVLAQGGCATEQLDPVDLGRASAEQAAAVAREQQACAAQRDKERRDAEARRVAEEKRKEAERKRKEYLERCARLKSNFDGRALDKSDDTLAGDNAELLRRLADDKLRRGDVSKEFGEFPCQDTEVGKHLQVAYVRAVVKSVKRWARTHVPSKSAQQLLIAHRAEADPDDLKYFDGRIEYEASRAVRTAWKRDIERNAALCRMKQKMELPAGAVCNAVYTMEKSKK